MVKRVFHDVAQRLCHPFPVAQQRQRAVAGEDDLLALLGKTVFKALFHSLRQRADIHPPLGKFHCAGVQLRYFQQVLHKSFYPLQFPFREVGKAPHRVLVVRLALHYARVDVQRGERGFQLVRNVRDRVLQKELLRLFAVKVRIQHGGESVYPVEEAVELTLAVALYPRAVSAVYVFRYLRLGVL